MILCRALFAFLHQHAPDSPTLILRPNRDSVYLGQLLTVSMHPRAAYHFPIWVQRHQEIAEVPSHLFLCLLKQPGIPSVRYQNRNYGFRVLRLGPLNSHILSPSSSLHSFTPWDNQLSCSNSSLT